MEGDNVMLDLLKKLYPYLAPVVAIIAIIVAIINGVSLKSENSRLNNELINVKEKNANLFLLLVKQLKEGNLTLGELSGFLKDADVQDISKKVSESTRASLPFSLVTQFYPSGWMGDGEFGTNYISAGNEQVELNGVSTTALCIDYRQGPKGWAGLYWQYPEKNWGDNIGRNLIDAKKIVFFARGDKGGEIVEFKSGGITGGRYHDTFEKSIGKIVLSRTWVRYEIDLQSKDLSNVIGAFAWIASGNDNQGHVITYVSNITVE
jgi:hypothetical protein